MFFSNHGTPVGWRNNHGYGSHTFKWVNAQGRFVYIKYHFIAKHGQKQFTQREATQMCGEDPDFSKRDLWEAIEQGQEIEWTAMVQVMEPQDADPEKLGFDPFDVTKVWPREQFPMQEFGKLVLNKNPENYHRDVSRLLSLRVAWFLALKTRRMLYSSFACSSIATRSITGLASTFTRYL